MIISVEEAVKNTSQGKLLIVVDDVDRENEGDFFIATEKLTPEIVNFMATEGRGLICVSLPEHRLRQLKMKEMTNVNTNPYESPFFCSCEAKEGVTTGISAYDRAVTMAKLIDDGSTESDFVYPGHCFPLKADRLGVLGRNGHTEASADLAALAKLKPSGVIVEIMGKTGKMAKMDELEKISHTFNIGIVTIKSLVEYRNNMNLTDSLYTTWK